MRLLGWLSIKKKFEYPRVICWKVNMDMTVAVPPFQHLMDGNYPPFLEKNKQGEETTLCKLLNWRVNVTAAVDPDLSKRKIYRHLEKNICHEVICCTNVDVLLRCRCMCWTVYFRYFTVYMVWKFAVLLCVDTKSIFLSSTWILHYY